MDPALDPAALSPVSTGIGDDLWRVYTIPVFIQATQANSAWPSLRGKVQWVPEMVSAIAGKKQRFWSYDLMALYKSVCFLFLLNIPNGRKSTHLTSVFDVLCRCSCRTDVPRCNRIELPYSSWAAYLWKCRRGHDQPPTPARFFQPDYKPRTSCQEAYPEDAAGSARPSAASMGSHRPSSAGKHSSLVAGVSPDSQSAARGRCRSRKRLATPNWRPPENISSAEFPSVRRRSTPAAAAILVADDAAAEAALGRTRLQRWMRTLMTTPTARWHYQQSTEKFSIKRKTGVRQLVKKSTRHTWQSNCLVQQRLG